jgi:4-amino-4-deoxy-L-arabinose transferase-like glycosyltransferase
VKLSNRRKLLLLLLVFSTAALIRLWVVSFRPTPPTADAADYHRLATSIAQGAGYVTEAGLPTAWRPPGYPIFLSGIYLLFGPRPQAATFVQALLGAVIVVLLVVLGWLIIGLREAMVAGFLAAAFPGLVWLPRLLLSENLAIFLLLASLCLALALLRSGRPWWAGALGLVLGISTLVRGANLLFVLLMLAGILLVLAKKKQDRKKLVMTAIFITFGVLITLLPWTIRNYRVFGAFVPVATQDGIGLYSSYWPPVRNGKTIWGTLPGPEDPAIRGAAQMSNEYEASRYLQRVTLERLRSQPLLFFRLVPGKMASLLVPLDWEILPHANGSTRSVNFGYLLIIFPAIFGFVLLWRKPRPDQWLLWIVPIVVLAQSIFFYGSPRFRLPAELIAILLAGNALMAAWTFLKTRLWLVR